MGIVSHKIWAGEIYGRNFTCDVYAIIGLGSALVDEVYGLCNHPFFTSYMHQHLIRHETPINIPSIAS